MKVAIVHYWLVTMRGGEKVLEELCKLFPQADIFTNVYDESKISDIIKSHKIFTTKINKWPMAKKMYQKYSIITHQRKTKHSATLKTRRNTVKSTENHIF